MADDSQEQLKTYIQIQHDQGVANEHIRQTLLTHGWQADAVDKALAESGDAPTTAVATPAAHSPEQPELAPLPPVQAPTKYKLFQAIADTYHATRANLRNATLSIVVSVALYFGLSLVAASFLIVSIWSKVSFSENTPVDGTTIAIKTILFIILMMVIGCLVGALVTASIAKSLSDGAEKRKTSFREVIRFSLHRIVRVALTELLVGIIMVVPIIIAWIVMLAASIGQHSSSTGANLRAFAVYGILLAVAAIAWIIVITVRCSLAPFVAIFEPEVPILKTLSRSRHLLQKGGQWFVCKGILLALGLSILASLVSGNPGDRSGTMDVIETIISVILSIASVGVMTMLYRNRRAARP